MPHDDINRSIPCRPRLVRYTWQPCTAAIPVALTPVGWRTTGAEGREGLEVMLVHIGFSCKGSLALNDQSRTGSFGWKGRGSQPGVLPVVFQEIVTAASAATQGSCCPRLHLFVEALGGSSWLYGSPRAAFPGCLYKLLSPGQSPAPPSCQSGQPLESPQVAVILSVDALVSKLHERTN